VIDQALYGLMLCDGKQRDGDQNPGYVVQNRCRVGFSIDGNPRVRPSDGAEADLNNRALGSCLWTYFDRLMRSQVTSLFYDPSLSVLS
jgi:hypothetical protein